LGSSKKNTKAKYKYGISSVRPGWIYLSAAALLVKGWD